MTKEMLTPQEFIKQVADKRLCDLEENIGKTVQGQEKTTAKKENKNSVEQDYVTQILSPQVKKEYLASFTNLSPEQVKKKSEFFDKKIESITKKIQKEEQKNGKIDDVNSFAMTVLSKGPIYSKINKAVNKVENKNKDMNFDNPNINKRDADINKADTKSVTPEEIFNNSSADELRDLIKESQSGQIDKNVSEINEELEDVQSRISNMESALKSPTTHVDDKGATTQADVDKLKKRMQELQTQEQKMKNAKDISQYIENNKITNLESRKKELNQMQEELKHLNDRVQEGQNYESKSSYAADDLSAGKDDALIKKRDALAKDVDILGKMIAQGEKIQEVLGVQDEEGISKPSSATAREDVLDRMEARGDNVDEHRQRQGDAAADGQPTQEEIDRGILDRDIPNDGTQNQEGGPDNNNEDVDNIDELDPDAVEPVEGGPNLEELNSVLDKAREDLVVKKRRSESSMDKIRSVLGMKGDTDNITEEIQGFQDAYDNAIEVVRAQLLQEQAGAPDARKKEINAQLMFMAKDESVKMQEAETKARLETKFGQLGDKIDEVGRWYKNLKPKTKYMIAGGLFAAGALTGGAGVAGGAITAAAGMKRLFGAVAMGVGVGMAVETKMGTKKNEKEAELRGQFEGLTLEQQSNAIQNMDLETQAEFDKIKTDRRRVKFTKIATVATFLVGGQMLSSAFGGHGQAADNITTGATHLESSLDAADSTVDAAVGVDNSMSEYMQQAKDLPETDRDRMEAYLIGLTKTVTDSGGTVNTELLNQEAQKAFEQYQFDGKVPTEAVGTGVDDLYDDPGANQMSEYMQQAKDLPETDRDRMEAYLIGLTKTVTDSGGTVNTELLHQEAQKAFEQYQFDGKTPSIDVDTEANDVYKSFRDAVDNVEQQKVEMAAWQAEHGANSVYEPFEEAVKAAEQQKAELAQWQEARGNAIDIDAQTAIDQKDNVAMEQSVKSGAADNPLSQGFNYIEMNADNVGTLVVEKGSSIEGTLIKFLETNSEKLTEGGMGWDPEDARWGGDVEKWAGARAHGLAQEFAKAHPGIDLDTVQPNTALNLDLSNPADVRVDIDFEGGPRIIPEGGKVEIATSGDNVEIPVQNTETPLAQAEIDTSASVEQATVVEEGTTKSTWVNPDTGREFTPAGEVVPEQVPSLAEVDVITELTKNPEFRTALTTQIKDIAGVEDIRNIANTQISLFESNDGGAINSKINGVINRAQQAFGDSAGAPQNNATVGSYVTRIFARAVQEGKVKDIFPSSDFSV